MCRDDSHGGRRCPSDTSEARQLRRKNSGARASYASLATPAVESKALPVAIPAEPFTVESVRAEIQGLRDLREHYLENPAPSTEVLAAYDKQLNVIGEGVSYLAETKYGAPTDEEILTADTLEKEKAEHDAMEKEKVLQKEYLAKKKELEEVDAQLEVIAPSEDYPSLVDRVQKWEVEAPELRARRRELVQEEAQARLAMLRASRDWQPQHRAAMNEILQKRNDGIKAALEELGVEFANPETLKFSEDSHADAVKSVKSAVQFYPQEWVDASNRLHDDREFRIKRSKGRAHYSSNRKQRKLASSTKVNVEFKPADFVPDPLNKADSELVEMENSKWVDPLSGKVQSVLKYRNFDDSKAYVRVHYDYSDVAKKGWEKVEYRSENYVSGQGWVSGEVVTAYRKPRLERELAEIQFKAELTVSKDAYARVGNDPSFRVALHEFAHRVEHANPHVTGYEDAFLRRRAGLLSTSTTPAETMSAINGASTERGYKDNFPTHYMGKVYSGSNYREILSMGMESLFAGKNGGFVGLESHNADPDYKKFILGVLASSAKTNK